MTVGGHTRTATTDEQGRAEFTNLPKGRQASRRSHCGRRSARLAAVQRADDRRASRDSGRGIAKAAERKKQEEAAAAAGPAQGRRRLRRQHPRPDAVRDDALEVYYILEILNTARPRVDIGGPLVIDFPRGAGATALEGSSPAAATSRPASHHHGSLRLGHHAGAGGVPDAVRLARVLTLEQTWPAALQQVTVGVERGEQPFDLVAAVHVGDRRDGGRRRSIRARPRSGAAGWRHDDRHPVESAGDQPDAALRRARLAGGLLACGVWLAIAKRRGHDDPGRR